MNSIKQENFFINAGPLLLVLFIDGMGLGLVFPILNGLIFDSQFLPVTSHIPNLQNIVYGAIIAIFMFCWFIGAAMLGDLSDQIGRKKALLICLGGAFFSYVLSAFAVLAHSLTLLIVGRMIAGFTAGSQPIAQAAIVDLSTPEHKARNIGYILLALSLGFIFGPLIGGVLSDPKLISWFNYATPFYFAAFISFFNVIILLALFKETFVAKNSKLVINPYHAIHIFISAFQNLSVRNLSILFFIFIFGWSSFYSFISLYLMKVHAYTPTQVSLYLTVLGVGFGIGNGFLVNYLAKFYTLKHIFIVSSLLTAAASLLIAIVPVALVNWLMALVLASFVATAYSAIVTIFSNQVDANSQGWVMGITGSIMALVWALNGIAVGVLAAVNPAYPLYAATICLVIGALGAYVMLSKTE